MRTAGLIGGMSWESSAVYYRLINQGIAERLGGAHSASLLLSSLDFAQVQALQHRGDWDALGGLMQATARNLVAAGAELLVLCTNTMHRLAPEIEAASPVPLLHIADAAGEALGAARHRRVGLLGTRFTMEQPFYRERLRDRHGLEVLVPEAADRTEVHRVIYDELVVGRIEPASRERYRAIIARLADAGAEAVLLGCTEIMLLIDADDAAVPLFDTTALHAAATVEAMLA